MTDPTYAQLMHKAETATSRKEAKKLINLATETMTKKTPAASICFYNVEQLNDSLIFRSRSLPPHRPMQGLLRP